MAREQEQAGRYQVLASPAGTGEPATGDHAGDLGADVITALRCLAEMINQRLQFRPFRSEQGFAVEGRGQGLIFGAHALSVADGTDGGLRLVLRGIPDPTWFDYLGGAMNVIRRIAVAAVVAAGLFVSMSSPAAADVSVGVSPHRHCLLTPKGWLPIAGGVSVKADEQDAPALDQFHGKVHTGKPTSTGGLIIVRVATEDKNCATARIP